MHVCLFMCARLCAHTWSDTVPFVCLVDGMCGTPSIRSHYFAPRHMVSSAANLPVCKFLAFARNSMAHILNHMRRGEVIDLCMACRGHVSSRAQCYIDLALGHPTLVGAARACFAFMLGAMCTEIGAVGLPHLCGYALLRPFVYIPPAMLMQL